MWNLRKAAFKGYKVRQKLDGQFYAVKRISVSGRQSNHENLHQISASQTLDNLVPCPSSKTSSVESILPEGMVVNQCSFTGDAIVYFDQTQDSVASSIKSLVWAYLVPT